MALIAVTVTSVVIVRRRLRYETWYFVHLYAYLGVALAFSHQLATGSSFVGRPGARAYWYALYAVTLGALVVFRIGLPLWRSARHRLRVLRVVDEGPGVVSLEIGGRQLGRLRARPGQFFTWRFLTRRHWWEAHPFSLSAAPDGRRLRITVKALGDHTRSLRDVDARHAGDRRRSVRRLQADGPRRCADRRRDRHHAGPGAAGGPAR